MKKKMFLTSAIAMGVVAPAVAAPTNTGTFPSTGLMQEDYTYTNAATAENMDSVYEGSVNATAQYDVIDYILSAGQYLPKDSDVQTTCPAGSYCAGGTFQYDEDSDQGLTSCSTATSGIYALSAAGASSQNECYRQCTTTDVSHSTGVSGNYYYGDNNQCEPTACVKGWHVKQGFGEKFGGKPTGNTYVDSGVTMTEYTGERYEYGASISKSGSYQTSYGSGTKPQSYYGISEVGEWAVPLDNGFVKGMSRCSNQSGTGIWSTPFATKASEVTTVDNLTDETGKNCWCKFTGYGDGNGNNVDLSSAWVFMSSRSTADDCEYGCAGMCVSYTEQSSKLTLIFRAALLEAVNTSILAMCEATNYLLDAGKYLPADGETPTTCPAGYFCSGIGSVNYNEISDQGIQSCPTIDDATFTSVAGSSAVTACYQEDSAMSSAELNPFTTAHLDTSVSGNGYINGVKYKSATTTARRYATSATAAGEWAALDESDLEIEDLACVNGWHYKARLNLANTIGQVGGTSDAYITNTGSFKSDVYITNTGSFKEDSASYGATYYGLTDNNTWAVEYGSNKGMLVGQARCSRVKGVYDWDYSTQTLRQPITTHTTAELGSAGGQMCYCNLTGYTPAGGTLQSLSSPWVFSTDFGFADISASRCADACANYCANYCVQNMRSTLSSNLAFRAALFGNVSASAMCEANTITINWTHADQTDINANNAGTATYGSDVRTPVKANTYKGKTFKGWKFSKPEQTTTGGEN